MPLRTQFFNDEICSLLTSQNPRARSLFQFIRRTLRQFHLEGLHPESEIFNEAYSRGIAAIEKGTTINSPNAWMRTTAFNIIREHSRNHRRYQSMESEAIEKLLVAEEIIDLDLETVSLSIRELLDELEPCDRLLIELRISQNLSWKEVKQHLIELGQEPQTEAALRKRGQRLMQRLRQIYHEGRPPQSLVERVAETR